jgi:CHASE2 domain-containing sensor protein
MDTAKRRSLILIGATAPGQGDRYVTPQSASIGTIPGIEIQANILNGLLQHRSIITLAQMGWRRCCQCPLLRYCLQLPLLEE